MLNQIYEYFYPSAKSTIVESNDIIPVDDDLTKSELTNTSLFSGSVSKNEAHILEEWTEHNRHHWPKEFTTVDSTPAVSDGFYSDPTHITPMTCLSNNIKRIVSQDVEKFANIADEVAEIADQTVVITTTIADVAKQISGDNSEITLVATLVENDAKVVEVISHEIAVAAHELSQFLQPSICQTSICQTEPAVIKLEEPEYSESDLPALISDSQQISLTDEEKKKRKMIIRDYRRKSNNKFEEFNKQQAIFPNTNMMRGRIRRINQPEKRTSL